MAFQTQASFSEAAALFSTYDQRVADNTLDVNEALAIQIRAKRDQLLRESDWTQLPDAPVNQTVWATYRQLLRDLPEVAGFPNVSIPLTPYT